MESATLPRAPNQPVTLYIICTNIYSVYIYMYIYTRISLFPWNCCSKLGKIWIIHDHPTAAKAWSPAPARADCKTAPCWAKRCSVKSVENFGVFGQNADFTIELWNCDVYQMWFLQHASWTGEFVKTCPTHSSKGSLHTSSTFWNTRTTVVAVTSHKLSQSDNMLFNGSNLKTPHLPPLPISATADPFPTFAAQVCSFGFVHTSGMSLKAAPSGPRPGPISQKEPPNFGVKKSPLWDWKCLFTISRDALPLKTLYVPRIKFKAASFLPPDQENPEKFAPGRERFFQKDLKAFEECQRSARRVTWWFENGWQIWSAIKVLQASGTSQSTEFFPKGKASEVDRVGGVIAPPSPQALIYSKRSVRKTSFYIEPGTITWPHPSPSSFQGTAAPFHLRESGKVSGTTRPGFCYPWLSLFGS
jgi:hypothetical protein